MLGNIYELVPNSLKYLEYNLVQILGNYTEQIQNVFQADKSNIAGVWDKNAIFSYEKYFYE